MYRCLNCASLFKRPRTIYEFQGDEQYDVCRACGSDNYTEIPDNEVENIRKMIEDINISISKHNEDDSNNVLSDLINIKIALYKELNNIISNTPHQEGGDFS